MLELGAGASPLVALAALRAGAARVVATDGSPDVLRLLEANLAANAGCAAHSHAGSVHHRLFCLGEGTMQ